MFLKLWALQPVNRRFFWRPEENYTYSVNALQDSAPDTGKKAGEWGYQAEHLNRFCSFPPSIHTTGLSVRPEQEED
jgi:hypothetical protein